MKLYIKQKVLSLTDTFTIKDEAGNDRYSVEGEFFSFTHKQHVYDNAGNEVALVKRKFFTVMPEFEVYLGGNLAVSVEKKFTLFSQRYELSGVNWEVDGDYWAHEYAISSGGIRVVSVSKEWFTWGDSYAVDIASSVDELLAIATVLAIDCATETK